MTLPLPLGPRFRGDDEERDKDAVERGEALISDHDARLIAKPIPRPDGRQEEIDEAVASIAGRRCYAIPVTAEEILSARDEGRRS